MPKSKKQKRAQSSVAVPPMAEQHCDCPECAQQEMICANGSDFVIEGYLKIVHHGAPMFIIDDCQLSELVRHHFKPNNSPDGYHIGPVQILIIPVRE